MLRSKKKEHSWELANKIKSKYQNLAPILTQPKFYSLREKKIAEERMKQIDEQNARVNAAKFR